MGLLFLGERGWYFDCRSGSRRRWELESGLQHEDIRRASRLRWWAFPGRSYCFVWLAAFCFRRWLSLLWNFWLRFFWFGLLDALYFYCLPSHLLWLWRDYSGDRAHFFAVYCPAITLYFFVVIPINVICWVCGYFGSCECLLWWWWITDVPELVDGTGVGRTGESGRRNDLADFARVYSSIGGRHILLAD